MTRAPILADTIALAIAATGVALMARMPVRADDPARYRRRIAGAMLIGAALFLAGFATASWLATS